MGWSSNKQQTTDRWARTDTAVRPGVPCDRWQTGSADLRRLLVGLALVAAQGSTAAFADDFANGQAPAKSRRETVIVASPIAESLPLEDKAAAASVVTLDRTPRSGESLPELLRELPGTTVTRFGGLGASAFVSVRGSTWEQVRIYVDGVPLNLAAGGDVDSSSIPVGSIERIEVYRSMSPIAFGSSALGGIVSITTRTPRTTGVEAEAGVGSFFTRFAGVNASWAGARQRVYAGVHMLDSKGDFAYRSDNGTAYDRSDDESLRRQNGALRQYDGVVRGVIDLPGRRELSLSGSFVNREQGQPGFGIYRTREAALATTRGILSLGYHGRQDLGPGGHLRALAYATTTEQQFTDLLSEIAIIPTLSQDRTNAAGMTLRASRPVTSWLRLAGIVDGRLEHFRPSDRVDANNLSGEPAKRLFGSTGVEADFWWSQLKLDIIPSARIELSRDVRTGRSAFGDPLPPGDPVPNALPLARLAVVQRPWEPLTLKANVGRYARLPSFVELYGNTGFLVGNASLQPETAWNGDVGFTLRTERSPGSLTLEGSAFGAQIDELIQFQQDAFGRAHPKNIGRARISGFEGSAEARLRRWGRLFAQFTYTDARDTSDSTASSGRQLPLRPRFRTYVRPELVEIGLGRGFEFGAYIDLDLTDGNFLDRANLVEIPARALLGAGASLTWSRTSLRLIASAQNLSDSRINDVAGFPLPGRAFYLTLAGRFGDEPQEHKQ